MPPEPYEYQGPAAIGAFLRDRARPPRRAAPAGADPRERPARLRLLPPDPQTDIARPYGMIVLTLEGDRISAITWFADSSVFPHFGLPRMLR